MENISVPSQEKISKITDEGSAKRILDDRGIDNPSRIVNRYISLVPDLIEWFQSEGRDYRWRSERDPWRILLTEILLQRTRADAVSEVYDEIIDSYPDPEILYRTDMEELKKQIESLGFVNQRAKSLKDVSKIIVEEHGGEVPENREELQEAWRVGEYVSRSVQIFARGKPMALVDSNIARVIGRFFGIDMPSQPHKNDQIYELVDSITPKDPEITRAYYFAIIDLGALVCTPENPDHESCPLKQHCRYYND